MPALIVKGLNCAYQNNQVLDNLDLTLEDNEIVCLLGESGCGKTTLLKAIAGLQGNVTGQISINNKLVDDNKHHLSAEDRKVGFIFQDYALFPHLNVFDNVAFSLFKMHKATQKKRVDDVLSLVRLNDYATRFPHQLSGGQQQRVAIARALAYQPDLMLLDEPFSNLDHHVRFQIIDEIKSLLKIKKMSAIFVTHSKEEGFAFADKIALMQAGSIIQIGSPQDLYNRPNSRYVADFMGSSNYIKVNVKDDYSYESDFGILTADQKIPFDKGTALLLLLRPEDLQISAIKSGAGIIKSIGFLGANYVATVTYKGVDYKVDMQKRETLAVGDMVALNISTHQFIVFNESKS